jgi:predicted ATPase
MTRHALIRRAHLRYERLFSLYRLSQGLVNKHFLLFVADPFAWQAARRSRPLALSGCPSFSTCPLLSTRSPLGGVSLPGRSASQWRPPFPSRAGFRGLLFSLRHVSPSLLTAALMERLAAEPNTRLRYFCSPQHTDSALYPIITQMERAAGFAHDDTLQTKLDKLDTLLARSFTPPQNAALLANMLSLPNDGRYPTLELDPQQQRQKTLEALTAQLETLSHQTPVLMIFEDAHWADPTSLEAFGRAVDRIRTLGVLLIVTYRPEFEPAWIGRPYVTAVILNRLGEREIAAIIDSVTGNKMLSANVRRDIIERTDGIPLFVEEMTKAVLETAGDDVRTAAAIPLSSIPVPPSLHASLMARLDRLGSAKEIAQVGAVIGREFSHALLAGVVRKPETELRPALNRLVEAGLLFRQGVPPHASYLFKHALVQDAAYGTLLREPRRELHARVANTLQREFEDIPANRPEVLARHCTEAGMIEKAASLWGVAGQRSLARSAMDEASEQFTRALRQIADLPRTPEHSREEIKLQVGLVNALMHTKGYAAPQTMQATERARTLIAEAETRGELPEDPLLLFSVLYGSWVANQVAFNGDAMRALGTQFLRLAEEQMTPVPIMCGHRLVGVGLLLTGDIAASRSHLDRAVTLYDPALHHTLAMRFGVDIRVAALSYQSWALWIVGHPLAALANANTAVKNARDTGHAPTLMFALQVTAVALIECGIYAPTNAMVDELIILAEKKAAPYWKAQGVLLHGCLFALTGREQEAVQTIKSGIAEFRSTGSTVFAPWHLSNLSKAYVRLGQIDEAWRCVGDAISIIGTTGERWCEADVHRLAGEIAILPSAHQAEAEAFLDHAISVSRQQQAKSWELRASMSLARLWRNQGKVQPSA